MPIIADASADLRAQQLRPTRDGDPVPIWELQHHHCRFIVREGSPEDTRYCGEPVTLDAKGETTSWCSHHRAIVYAGPRVATGRPFVLTTRRAA